jgi:hypothetical protein
VVNVFDPKTNQTSQKEQRMTPTETPKPYHQRPGEPGKWYDRFCRFSYLGPSRTLRQCYRLVFAEKHALARGEHLSHVDLDDLLAEDLLRLRDKRVPGAWVKRAREFDWLGRAAAWDADQRNLAVKRSELILNRITKATLDALQIHIDMMYGRHKDPDGAASIVYDQYQIRMAAKTVLSKGLDLLPLLLGDHGDDRPEIKITEIRVNDPSNHSEHSPDDNDLGDPPKK